MFFDLSIKSLILLSLSIAPLVICLKKWQNGVYLLFLWLPFDDLIRKYFGHSLIIYLVKDLLVVYILISYFINKKNVSIIKTKIPSGLVISLFLYFFISLLGALNPMLSNIIIPFVGMKLVFYYVLLLFIGYWFSSDLNNVKNALKVIWATGLVVAVIGIVQAYINPDFLRPKPEPGYEAVRLWMTRGEGIQYVSSVFLSPGRYVFFLINIFAFGIALLEFQTTKRERAIFLTGNGIVALGLFTSGARTGIVALILFIIGMLLMNRFLRRGRHTKQYASKSRNKFKPIILIMSMALIFLVVFYKEESFNIATFYKESLMTPEVDSGFLSRIKSNLDFSDLDIRTWLFGNGTGSSSFGVYYFVEDFNYPNIEGGYIGIIWELGIVGLLCYVWVALNLSKICFPSGRLIKESISEKLIVAFGPLIILELWILNIMGPILQQYVVAIYLWFFTGIILGLRRANLQLPNRQ